MQIFRHETHTVYVLRDYRNKKRDGYQTGVTLIHQTGRRMCARALWHPKNLLFYVQPGKLRWHWMIRLPFFWYERNNCGFEIGHPNLYLWVELWRPWK